MIGGRSALLAAGAGLGYGNWTGNYEDVSLLLRGNTTPGQLVIADESYAPKSLTIAGNASISYNPVKYGSTSISFDGTDDWIETNATNDFYFANEPFTIEAWVYLNQLGADYGIFSYMNNGGATTLRGYVLNIGTDGAVGFVDYNGSVQFLLVTPSPVITQVNQWYHVAVCKEGTGTNQVRLFVNGQIVASATRNANIPVGISGLPGRIGAWRYSPARRSLNGYIDDLRITKGVARYVANFTPSELPSSNDDPLFSNVTLLMKDAIAPLLAADESPTPKTITDTGDASISTTVFKYGTSSLMFDGNGDWFETNATTDFDFGNNPFTIEAWVYAITLNHVASPAIFSNMNNGTAATLGGYVLAVDSTGNLLFNDYNQAATSFSLTSPAGAITTGQWYHVAICKAGTDTNQVKLFVNGQIVASGTRNANIPVAVSGLPGRVGAWRYSVEQRPWNGYIDDLRITKGFARYTKNFLPPPAELPAI
jgi:hypothetical protein